MLSFINMECPSCGSVYTLSVEDPNVIATFSCFECEQNCVYFAGRVLTLDKQIMESAEDGTKRQHVKEALQQYADALSRDALGNTGKVVNVNTPVDLGLPEDNGNLGARAKQHNGVRRGQCQPSIRRPEAPEISRQDVRDFVRIDLNLIDDRKHFDECFGQSNN